MDIGPLEADVSGDISVVKGSNLTIKSNSILCILIEFAIL